MFCSNCGKEVGNSKFCSNCGNPISSNNPQQQTQPLNQNTVQTSFTNSNLDNSYIVEPVVKKPLYKKWWFWIIIIICFFIIISIATSGNESKETVPSNTVATIENTKSKKSNDETKKEESSSKGSSGLYDLMHNYLEDDIDSDIPSEYKAALLSAKSYSDTLHMSKKGIYEQLISEYGDQFEPEAAQYAIDNLDADYKANALASAKNYRDTMHMSKAAIYDQLVSEYGEQFTKEEAQYAIDNLD